MSYPVYDNFNRQSFSYPSSQERSLSRRRSRGHRSSTDLVPSHHNSIQFPQPNYHDAQQGLMYDNSMAGPLTVDPHAEAYHQPAYQIYDPRSQPFQGDVYDDPVLNRHLSATGYQPVIPRVSRSRSRTRSRRHSSVSFSSRPSFIDDIQRLNGSSIKFKRKGAFRTGITLGEAQADVRLSSNDAFTFRDMHADHRGHIQIKIKWGNYKSLMYEIPLKGHEGRVHLQTLARRTARAVAHYLQANLIAVPWDNIVLHHLEEIFVGTWEAILSTN